MISAPERHVAFFAYPRFVLLDLTGPLEAFAAAADLAPGSYRLSVMSLEGGEVESSARLNVMTQMAVAEAIDTFVVVGDFDLPDRRLSPATIAFIRAVSAGAPRPASDCLGAFLLDPPGPLAGRGAPT